MLKWERWREGVIFFWSGWIIGHRVGRVSGHQEFRSNSGVESSFAVENPKYMNNQNLERCLAAFREGGLFLRVERSLTGEQGGLGRENGVQRSARPTAEERDGVQRRFRPTFVTL